MRLLLALPAFLALAWVAATVWFDGPTSRVLAGALAAGLGLGGVALYLRLRPAWRALAAVAALVGAATLWWLGIPPSNDRKWQPDVARPAEAHFDGSRVTIQNVRNFHYRTETDFDEIWETREYDLDRLTGVDLLFSFWGPTLIAHTVVSWEFEDAPPLAISIETRKEVGEAYSAVLGFFRQYELYYVVSDERDVIGVRTNHRGEHVYLYRIRMPVEEARALLVDYLETIEHLAHHPRWYNALTHNCTTTIRQHTTHVGQEGALDWRILVNGRLEELLYERGRIDTALPFAELRKRSEVTERAKAAGTASDFSRQIRVGIPRPSVARPGS
jgi:hypothetical protein